MKRFALAMVVSFVFPLVAWGNTVDYDTGLFKTGVFTGSFSTMIEEVEVGHSNTISIDTGTLTKLTNCTPGSTCYQFSGGTVSVEHGGKMVFTDALTGGLVIQSNGVASINASLAPESGVVSGAAVATMELSGNQIVQGSSNVSFSSTLVTPEPSTMSLMGIAVLGIGGFSRKQLRQRRN